MLKEEGEEVMEELRRRRRGERKREEERTGGGGEEKEEQRTGGGGEEKEEQRTGGGGEEKEEQRTGGGEEKEVEEQVQEVQESLMMELSRLVQTEVKQSSWWERRGKDGGVLTAAFITLIPAFLLLSSSRLPLFLAGLLLMGVSHAVLTIKGTHLATHGALSLSPTWNNVWAVFFIELCGSFSARAGLQGHIKLHHAHTNVLGLGDSSVWKVPFLPRSLYLFMAPLALPLITPLVALVHLRDHSAALAARTLLMMFVGVFSQYWLLIHVSGFGSAHSALLCMMLCRSMFSVPYIHVNIFQHIGLPMFSPSRRPKRIHQMTLGVLNLPRNLLLDWVFGHSLISCHVEHHLFPHLSDNMCLKVKPVVSRYLREKQLPYQEASYLSRLRLFFHRYQELMVLAPPITELVGGQ